MTRRILSSPQKCLFGDSGTHIGGRPDSAIGDLVGEALADFASDAATGGKASCGSDGACAKSFQCTIACGFSLAFVQTVTNPLQGLDGVGDVGQGFGTPFGEFGSARWQGNNEGN